MFQETNNNKKICTTYLLMGQVKKPPSLLGWASWDTLEEESEGQALKKRPGHPWVELILTLARRTGPHYPRATGGGARRLRFLCARTGSGLGRSGPQDSRGDRRLLENAYDVLLPLSSPRVSHPMPRPPFHCPFLILSFVPRFYRL